MKCNEHVRKDPVSSGVMESLPGDAPSDLRGESGTSSPSRWPVVPTAALGHT